MQKPKLLTLFLFLCCFAISASAAITGRVYNDTNSNGVDNAEAGIAGVRVLARDGAGLCYIGDTDGTGAYSMTAPDATYTLYEVANTSYPAVVFTNGTACSAPVTSDFQLPFGFNGATTRRSLAITVVAGAAVGSFGHDNTSTVPCTGAGFTVRGNPSTLYSMNIATGVETVLNPSLGIILTIGYNPVDRMIWGPNRSVRGTVARVSGTNAVTFRSPAIAGLPLIDLNSGDIDENGLLYLSSTNLTSIYVVDVNPNSPAYLTLVRTLPITAFPGSDMAYTPLGLVAVNVNTVGVNPHLFAMNTLAGGTIDLGPITGAGIESMQGFYGAVFYDAAGRLFAKEGVSGKMFWINLTTLVATLLNTATTGNNNDAAFCPMATAPIPNPMTTLTKSCLTANCSNPQAPGTDLIWSMDLRNTGIISAHTPTITDPIPAHTDFKLGSVAFTTSALTSGVVEYSNDGGATWTYTPVNAGGGAAAGYDRSVTNVRVVYAGQLQIAETVNLTFTTIIR